MHLQLACKHCNAKYELRNSNLKRWFQSQSQNCELTIFDTSFGIIYLHQIPRPFYAWNLNYWEPKSKELFGPTKTVLEVLNDIEVWQADSPDGVNIAELFFSMFIINVINLKLSIFLVLFLFFFRSTICNDKALFLKIITYILVPAITTLFGVLCKGT